MKGGSLSSLQCDVNCSWEVRNKICFEHLFLKEEMEQSLPPLEELHTFCHQVLHSTWEYYGIIYKNWSSGEPKIPTFQIDTKDSKD